MIYGSMDKVKQTNPVNQLSPGDFLGGGVVANEFSRYTKTATKVIILLRHGHDVINKHIQ